jgi:ribosomal protein L7/L12
VDDAQLARRFELIEAQLRLLSEQLGLPYAATVEAANASELPPEVVELARAGNKTEAVKQLRQLTGATLLEAMRAIDAL